MGLSPLSFWSGLALCSRVFAGHACCTYLGVLTQRSHSTSYSDTDQHWRRGEWGCLMHDTTTWHKKAGRGGGRRTLLDKV